MATIGDRVRFTATFRDSGGVLADPDTVTVTITDPVGADVPAAVVQDSTGVYHADVVVSVWGAYQCNWSGVSTPPGLTLAETHQLLVTD